MKKLDFSLKLTSPAFIAGAMQRGKERQIGSDGDGLRIPSLRGIIRFWFRAMYGHLPRKELYALESHFMGDAGTIGQGLRLIPYPNENFRTIVIGEPKLNTKVAGSAIVSETVSGTAAMMYLGFGPIMSVNNVITSNTNKMLRKAIGENEIFKFRAIGNPTQIAYLKHCLILIHLFGGIGARSRRSWGSLALHSSSEKVLPDYDSNNQTILDWIRCALAQVWLAEASTETSCEPSLLLNAPSTVSILPEYSAFSKHTQVRISLAKSDYSEVMEEFYDRFKETRIWDIEKKKIKGLKQPYIAQQDHDLELLDLTSERGENEAIPRRVAFGLPYTVRFKGHKAALNYVGPDKKDRRASPLFLKTFLGPDKKYYALSLFLKSQFWGKGEAKLKAKNHKKLHNFPGWEAVEEFLDRNSSTATTHSMAWQKINLP